ncbi:MAG TPA: glycosyltransferase family 4 protein [Gemmatimonadaceae bacterium]|nr:glycosyltransferase family 4 protein [Gemmatimonadaceae bacterium]
MPDSIHWITGTIARSFVAHNPWLDGTVISGPVLDIIARDRPEFFDSFDVVHFVCPYASRTWLPLLRNRLPVITSHHHVSDDWKTQHHNLEGDAIVVGSSQWADDVVQRGAPAERVVAVPYGVDASRFVPATPQQRKAARASLGIASDAIVVGFFAKFSSNELDRKGTDIFALAARALSEKEPRLAVLIIGPGWRDLVAQLRAAGVRVVWIPFVREADRMPLMYQALDLYWVTARVEGGPVTLLEAMSSGVCCITTPVGLARDIVQDGVNGVLAPFNNAGAFVEHSLRLVSASGARAQMGALARETILETMNVPITARGVGRAYDIAIAHFKERSLTPTAGATRKVASPDSALLDRIAVLEQLVWAEALMLQGQRALALRIIAETWVKHPLSTLPPRFLFRNLLPPRLVKAIVRVKAGIAGTS